MSNNKYFSVINIIIIVFKICNINIIINLNFSFVNQ
jgi:hypothetical protein